MAGLGSDIKVRVSDDTKAALVRIAKETGEGTAISDVARKAISEFLRRAATPPLERSEDEERMTRAQHAEGLLNEVKAGLRAPKEAPPQTPQGQGRSPKRKKRA